MARWSSYQPRTPAPESNPILHPNIRGASYFVIAQGGSHAD
ncbi:hypothetical protein DFAR_2940017 [Desulfarculales bacterium]